MVFSFPGSAWEGQVKVTPLPGGVPRRSLSAERQDMPLDLNLPHTDGRQVLAEVRADPALRWLPVIILTSSRGERDLELAYECGANSYLLKPNTLDEYYALTRNIAEFWGRWATLPTKM